MASLDYEKLLEELAYLIKKKSKISWKELKNWTNSKKIGFLTLSLLLEDLKEKLGSNLKFSEEKILLDEILEIYVPNEIMYLEKINIDTSEEKNISLILKEDKLKNKNKEKKTARKRIIQKSTKVSILDFFEKKEKILSSNKDFKKKEYTFSEKKNDKKDLFIEHESKKEETSIKDLADNKDMEIAISYLAKYWSVGEIRFVQDLKRMGVKDPRKVINKMIEKGYIERINIGIINAKEIIRKYKITTPLSEIFN